MQEKSRHREVYTKQASVLYRFGIWNAPMAI